MLGATRLRIRQCPPASAVKSPMLTDDQRGWKPLDSSRNHLKKSWALKVRSRIKRVENLAAPF
jgi:hypothetical protein